MGRALWIADKLREYGVRVVEIDGWKSRGSSTFNPRGVVAHHTAGGSGEAPSLKICINGRSDLAGPLANIVLGRSGTAYVIASGRANHAGRGGWNGLAGNSSVFGIEAENNGVGEPWPKVQVDAYVNIVAALCDGANIDVKNVCGHKEWAPSRKIDPRGIEMNDFRGRVSARLGKGIAKPAPAPSNVFKLGDRGPGVKRIQEHCNFWGWNAGAVDGIFGKQTQGAVKRAQSVFKIPADGIWGPQTEKAYTDFVSAMIALNAKPKGAPPLLRRGDKGEWVKVAQRKLGALVVDGDFGTKTHARVIKMQRLWGLVPDGIIGPKTWAKLGY